MALPVLPPYAIADMREIGIQWSMDPSIAACVVACRPATPAVNVLQPSAHAGTRCRPAASDPAVLAQATRGAVRLSPFTAASSIFTVKL